MVSIRARHHCRAIRRLSCFTKTSWCFNPRPASLPGDPVIEAAIDDQGRVSIRARHHCRAILAVLCWIKRLSAVSIRARHHCRAIHPSVFCADERCCFNPRPASLPGDPTSQRTRRLKTMFQSAPGITAGRSRVGCYSGIALSLFQSAPGITAGRSLRPTPQAASTQGFNPRPASLPGDPPPDARSLPAGQVSIRARHHCRAIRFAAK